MKQRSRFLIAAAALAGGVAVWRVARRDHAVAMTAELTWPAGTELTYTLSYRSHDDVVIEATGQHIVGETEIAGDLVLRSRGIENGHYLLELTVDPRVHHIAALGRELVADDATAHATFAGQRAYLGVRPDGVIDGVWTAPGTPELFVNIAQTLAAELEVALPKEARTEGRWQTVVHDLQGDARVQYRAAGTDAIERSRVAYQRLRALPGGLDHATQALDSRHAIKLAAGHIASLREHETLHVARDDKQVLAREVSMELSLARTSHTVVASAPPGLVRNTPGGLAVDPNVAHRMLEQRVGDYTEDKLVDDLMMTGAGLGNDNAWMWRSVGLLQLHPEACERLVALFSDEQLDSHARQLVLDLLVGAGHREAQKALREVLETPEATSDRQYVYMLQRTALLAQPDGETVAFVAKHLDDARTAGHVDEARASLYALGAAAGRLASTDPVAARGYHDRLARELDGARTPDDRAAALHAIGNAAFPDDAPRVLHEAAAEDHAVRAAAASALRNVTTPDATTALLGLASDASPDVSAEALASLRDRPLDGAQLDQLAAAAPELMPSTDAVMVAIAGDRLEQGDPAVHILQAIAEHGHDPDAQARARTLLSRISSN